MQLPWLTEEEGGDGKAEGERWWCGGSVLQQNGSAIAAFYTGGSIAEISPFDHKPSLSPLKARDNLHVFLQ